MFISYKKIYLSTKSTASTYISGYAGTDSAGSLKSISTTAETIRNPTKINAGAVANPGIVVNNGAKMIANKNNNPVTTEESPVLAPSDTPEELSTNVVVVDVPRIAPALVAIASAKSAGSSVWKIPG